MLFVNCNAQVKIFEKYNFSQGGYELFIIDESDIDIFSDKVPNDSMLYYSKYYIINSISILDEIKEKVTGEVSNWGHNCGYDFHFIITLNDTVISKSRINTRCNSLSNEDNVYYFKSEVLKSIIQKADLVEIQCYTFKTRNDALLFYEKTVIDSTIIMKNLRKPNWIYEGKFEAKFRLSKKKTIKEYDRIILDSIKSNFPDDKFTIDYAGYGLYSDSDSLEIRYDIHCNKSLFKKYKLSLISKDWYEYQDFELITFKRKKPNR